MTQRAAVAAGRRFAESQMLDTCTVRTITGQTTNPTTGAVTSTYATVYTGPCKVATYEPQEQRPDVASASVTVQRYSLHVPVGSFAPQVGMVATITASDLDPYLTGREFRVVALLHKTAATAYRLGVEEVTA